MNQDSDIGRLVSLERAVEALEGRVARLEAGKKDKHVRSLTPAQVPRSHPGGAGPAR